MKSIRLSPEAESELDRIWLYVARESGVPSIADRVVDAIEARMRLLVRNPQIGRRRDRDLRPGIRSLAVGEYVVLYRIAEDEVVVLHILHGRRDIANLVD